MAIVLAAKRWGHLWANHCVIIYSDNQAAMHIINKGTTGNEVIMEELRALFWLSALHNIHMTAAYLEGFRITIADAISRVHDHNHLLSFYSVLNERLGHAAADNSSLTDHMSSYSRSFVFSKCTRPSVGVSVATGSF